MERGREATDILRISGITKNIYTAHEKTQVTTQQQNTNIT